MNHHALDGDDVAPDAGQTAGEGLLQLVRLWGHSGVGAE